jgi:hypothetical protein
VGGVADGRDRPDDRPGRDLAQRDRVQELGIGHPVIGVDGIALHQRDDHEPAAKGERADLERRPREGADPARGDRRRPQGGKRRGVSRRARRCTPPNRQLEQATGQQHEHEIRADERRSDRTDDQIAHPAAQVPAVLAHPPEARAHQPKPGVDRNCGDGGAGAGAGAANPGRWRLRQKQHREREDQHHRRDDEPEPADDGAANSSEAVGAEDHQLRRGRAGEQAARGIGVLELAAVHPPVPIHDQAPQQRDVRGRPAEAGEADAGPLASDRAQRDGGGRSPAGTVPHSRTSSASSRNARRVAARTRTPSSVAR